MVLFIERVLYVSGLTLLSTSIPSETFNFSLDNFQLFTIRSDDDQTGDTLNTVINGIDIILNSSRGNDDVILIGISVNSTSNVTFYGNNTDECLSQQGTLDGNELSVTILNSSNSSKEIDIIFHKVLPHENNGMACVWLNEETQKWDTTGCNSTYIADKQEIRCHCSHLTTFSTIRNLKDVCNTELLSTLNEQFFLYLNAIFAFLFFSIILWFLYHTLR
eukprot:217353_1